MESADYTFDMTPFVYTLGRHDPLLFPTLDSVVRYLIANEHSPYRYRDRWSNVLRARVEGMSEPQEVDLSAYMEQRPVDEAAARAEMNVAVANSYAEYQKRWPHGRTGPRFSGDHMLCESSPEELEGILACEIERRSWKWKALP